LLLSTAVICYILLVCFTFGLIANSFLRRGHAGCGCCNLDDQLLQYVYGESKPMVCGGI
jgi:hypothetical protein